MLMNYLKPVLFFIPLAIIQLVVIPLISIYNITPNLVLILIVYYTLKDGQIFGTILGFILGLLLDLFSGGLIGAFMFSFTISAFLAGYFYSENKMDTNLATYFFLLIVFISACVNSFLFARISNSTSNVSLLLLLIEEGLLPGLYTTLFGLPIVVFNSRKGI
jgi:rod shape-determining protein MreD